MRRLLFLLAFILAAQITRADKFVLKHGDKTLEGGQVCLFEAGGPDDPVARLTGFRSVTCQAAENVTLRPGRWNLVARHNDGFVSEHLLLVVDGAVEGDARTISMAPAIRLPIIGKIEPGDFLGLYVEESAIVIPLVPGETEIGAPDGSTVHPLLVRDGRVERIGPKARVGRSGAEISVPGTGPGRDVVVGLLPDRDAFAKFDTSKREAGSVVLLIDGKAPVASVNSTSAAFRSTDSLALFRNITAADGGLKARVVGDAWLESEVALADFRSAAPLRIAPVTTLTVSWEVRDDVVAIREELSSRKCPRAEGESGEAAAAEAPSGLALALLNCPGMKVDGQPRYYDRRRCTRSGSLTLDVTARFGKATFKGVAPGTYLLDLVFQDLPGAAKPIEVSAEDASANIFLQFDRYFGKVTRSGEPLHVSIGFGYGGVSDPETGEYLAIRNVPQTRPAPPPGNTKQYSPTVFLEGCDEEKEWAYIPDEPPVPNTRFDIDVEANEVVVKAVDHSDGKPVANATISLGALLPGEDDGAHFAGEMGKTDERGEFQLLDPPTNRLLLICAVRDDYDRSCLEKLDLSENPTRSFTLALEKSTLRKGRIEATGLDMAQVIWHTPDGRIAERVRPNPAGEFSYKKPHTPGEIVSVISRNQPLFVFRFPPLRDDEEFVIRYPAAARRSFEVVLPPRLKDRAGFLGLVIGDVVVPGNVLGWHLGTRGLQSSFAASSTLAVADVLATGRLSVMVAPFNWLKPNWTDETVDVFYIPAAFSLPRTPVDDAPRVEMGD